MQSGATSFGYRDDGWAFRLAAAGLAADAEAPLLVVGDSAPEATVSAIDCHDELLVIGDDATVSGDVEQRLLGGPPADGPSIASASHRSIAELPNPGR